MGGKTQMLRLEFESEVGPLTSLQPPFWKYGEIIGNPFGTSIFGMDAVVAFFSERTDIFTTFTKCFLLLQF